MTIVKLTNHCLIGDFKNLIGHVVNGSLGENKAKISARYSIKNYVGQIFKSNNKGVSQISNYQRPH